VIVGDSDGVEGEDVGFAKQCRLHGVSQHILTDHSVLHFGGGADVMSAPCLQAILRTVRDTVAVDAAMAAELRTSGVVAPPPVASPASTAMPRWAVLGIGLAAITAVGTIVCTALGAVSPPIAHCSRSRSARHE
jgi:hypothetical protein